MDVPQVEILPDADSVAQRAASVVVTHARAAIGNHGVFTFAVSGGSTPWAMLSALAHEDFPWERTTIYQVDERIAPAGDPNRNLTHLRERLPSGTARVRPMPVEDADLDAAAHRYARSFPERFDLIHLGLGPDGHTASLVPDDPVLDIVDRRVALTQPYKGLRRMTITYPVIARAWSLLWVVTGPDKADALGRLRRHDHSIPAGRVATAHALILADAAAAGL
jgi:6-phosphogluconolactonase